MRSGRNLLSLILIVLHVSNHSVAAQEVNPADFSLIVLGVSQDGSYPQAGCQKECCKAFENGISERHFVTSLAICQESTQKVWLIDCGPDFSDQMRFLQKTMGMDQPEIAGIFLTHAHVGHYLGLADLGREIMGAQNVPVYAMPRMASFLSNNGPWSQLVQLNNIEIRAMKDRTSIQIAKEVRITPLEVPHRDEFSETVGFKIEGPSKSILFIPDIDKWEKWNVRVEEEISGSDIAFLDGTFYDDQELPGRNMKDIPHPFIIESIKRFESLHSKEKSKVHFIHFNHSNPLHFDKNIIKGIEDKGFHIAKQGQMLEL